MNSEILLYQTEDGLTKIEVALENETVWLTGRQMAELFQKDSDTIGLHIRNIYKEGELNELATTEKNSVVQQEGGRTVKRELTFYNLDVIISVGYRVKSQRGTQFRIWATQRLKEFIIKGFVLDDERLKSGGKMNYFDELLERIRDIRSSEKIFYQKVKDIYTTSIDYDAQAEMTQEFFAKIQNRLHWATHRHTAAELIKERADANQPNMGLTVWKGASIRKSDVTIAKNYLSEDELRLLNLLVEQYLAFAEAQAHAKRPMYMRDWLNKLNDILVINERDILHDAGSISKKLADEIAEKEFEKFKETQRLIEREQNVKQLEQEIKIIQKQRKKK